MSEEVDRSSKVAIVGGAWTRRAAPYDDPSWEIWAFSSLRLHTPRFTRWFEMHALEDLQGSLRRKTARRWDYASYFRFLQGLDCPVYMQKHHEEIPHSVAYPLQKSLDAFGRVFTSSASYLIAKAILEKFDTIGVFGIHLTEKTVYARQRPGVEYLLSVAKDRGIDVYLPKGSPLRIRKGMTLPSTEVLYGYDWQSPKAWWRKRKSSQRRFRKSKSRKRR